jgi:protoporphyrinogen oxidase
VQYAQRPYKISYCIIQNGISNFKFPISNFMPPKIAIIIGAGPAGLTAALELLNKTDIKPIIFEMSGDIGGIAKTVNYKGNRIDIGGHRFFSKSDRVMQWWFDIFPVENWKDENNQPLQLHYQGKFRDLNAHPENAPDPAKNDNVFLVRKRLSRIYYLRKFFNYPLSFTVDTIKKLGVFRIGIIGISYMKAKLFPVKPEKSLEDFFINRFGKELYETFFKDYTEKVWGFKCHDISPEWGAQRVKSLDITKAILHAISKPFKKQDIHQKNTETSLIERFIYPKYGPGQLWEEVARMVQEKGGELYINHELSGFIPDSNHHIKAVKIKDTVTGDITQFEGDYFFSTMPVKDLVMSFESQVPDEIRKLASQLAYRDFITVGLLLRKFKYNKAFVHKEDHRGHKNNLVPDNWIYIQEKDVKVGRLQIFNNWSPYMVADPEKIWIGLEYFCNEGDELWSKSDEDLKKMAKEEMIRMELIDPDYVLDSVAIRMKKTYPAYQGAYEDFDKIRAFTDGFENLFLIGRNGMHRYNNQDHSMLTAMTAVENIMNNITTKDNIWDVNTEQDYHEEK